MVPRILSSVFSRKKFFIPVAIIIILIIFWTLLGQKTNNTFVAAVQREDLVNTVLVNGTYNIASQTQVTSPTNGVISKLFVANGDMVKKGDPLYHVESSATVDQQKAAYATYLAASSTLQADIADLYTLQSGMYSSWKTYMDISTNSTYQNSDGSPNTKNRVLPEFTTAQDNWLAAEANYKNQQAVIAKDNAALSSAKQLYDETQSATVTSPATGEVINLADKVNDQVSVPLPQSATQTASVQEATSPVLIIADYSNPVLVASVDQANIPSMSVGQKASIVFDALPDQTFYGSVTHIDAAGTKNQGATDFNVDVIVNHIPSTIRPNMTASITIETAREDNVLTIPNDAIIKKNGKTYVQLAGKSSSDLTPVVLGLKALTKTEVISGLSEGDKVIEQQ